MLLVVMVVLMHMASLHVQKLVLNHHATTSQLQHAHFQSVLSQSILRN